MTRLRWVLLGGVMGCGLYMWWFTQAPSQERSMEANLIGIFCFLGAVLMSAWLICTDR